MGRTFLLKSHPNRTVGCRHSWRLDQKVLHSSDSEDEGSIPSSSLLGSGSTAERQTDVPSFDGRSLVHSLGINGEVLGSVGWFFSSFHLQCGKVFVVCHWLFSFPLAAMIFCPLSG